MGFVTGMSCNAKTKATSSRQFELDPSSSRPTFLCCLAWVYTVFKVLCDFFTSECATQPALRATSGSACVDFELGHQLKRCYCSFVVREIREVPAPLALAEGK